MEKEFISYSEALALKELGFDEPCFANYSPEFNLYHPEKNYLFNLKSTMLGNNECKAPTFSQAFRFFREKYGLHYIICKNIQMDGYGYREVTLIPYMEENENTIFKTYEEAEVECLVKLIEIAKEQNVT